MSLELKSNGYQNNLKEAKLSDTNIYEFDEFVLDASHLMLCRRGGEELPMTPKQVETLLALIERKGEIVAIDVLMDRLWPNAFVEESNLIQNIHILRKTLGETADGKPMIETFRRRGYRFNGKLELRAQVRTETAPHNRPTEAATLFKFPTVVFDKVAADEKSEPEAPPKKRMFAAVAAILLLAASLSVGYYLYSSQPVAAGDKIVIAVLPLKPINTANRDEIYEVGIADSVIQRFSSMKGFIVRPLSATRKYADIEQDALTAGREQQVDYVLASNYQMAVGKIRITAQLFNVATGQIEETYKTEKDAGDLFAMQDAIAGEVENLMRARFGTTASTPTAKRGTTNVEAYRLYLQGMILDDQRNGKKAIENFDQAVTLDPNYALAWAGKANALKEDYQESMEAADKALSLDPDLSEGHSAMCWNKFAHEYDFAGAERTCRRAVELDPNSPMAHQSYSIFLSSRGQFDEAIAEIKTAIDLEPTSYFNQRIYANVLYFARRYEEAVPQYKRLIELNDEKPATYQWLIRTLEAQGNESEAFEWFLKSLTLQKTDNETIQRYKAAYQRSGWHGVLLERDKEPDSGNYFGLAGFNARLGNKDKAFEFLESAYQEHEWLIPFLQVEPQLDPLRDDPRYDELIKRIGSK
ncbi:MAG: tetratricopeptide repeat protein [Pyrinomonadaceae bacterium]